MIARVRLLLLGVVSGCLASVVGVAVGLWW